CYGLFKALRGETKRQQSLQATPGMVAAHPAIPWKHRLAVLLHNPTRERAVAFLRDTVAPALKEVAEEIRGRGMSAEVEVAEREVTITVTHGEDAFVYGVALRSVPVPSFAMTALEGEREGPDHTWRAEVALREGGQRYDIMGFSKEQVIADLLGQYERHMHYLNTHMAG
ncbi:MAG: choline transporter, partial [Nitratireductor sp.]